MATVKYVLSYHPDPSSGAKAGELFPAHAAHFQAAAARGELLAFGPFTDLFKDGSLGIFGTKEAAEAFVAADPFVAAGVVTEFEIREWTDSVA